MLGSCVTSDDKCCIIFRPWTVTYVFWIMNKNKECERMKGKWNYKSHSKSRSASQKGDLRAEKSLRFFSLCCVRKLWTEKSEGRVGAIMEQEIGKLWKWKRKWDFKTFSRKTSFKISFFAPNRIKPSVEHRRQRQRQRQVKKKQISVPSSPASLHCGWTSTMSSREQPMDNRRRCLCVPKHFDRSRRCRWLFNRSCGCKLCSNISLFRKLSISWRDGAVCDAEWWCCCLLPLIWLRLCRDII